MTEAHDWSSLMPFAVLVVEDRPEVLQLLVTLLELDERFAVHAMATDGIQAVEAVAGGCPDAIICDLKMPRMGGLQALPRLRRSCPDAVIVMYTADPDAGAVARKLGADEVVDKTHDPTALIDLVAELCGSAS